MCVRRRGDSCERISGGNFFSKFGCWPKNTCTGASQREGQALNRDVPQAGSATSAQQVTRVALEALFRGVRRPRRLRNRFWSFRGGRSQGAPISIHTRSFVVRRSAGVVHYCVFLTMLTNPNPNPSPYEIIPVEAPRADITGVKWLKKHNYDVYLCVRGSPVVKNLQLAQNFCPMIGKLFLRSCATYPQT